MKKLSIPSYFFSAMSKSLLLLSVYLLYKSLQPLEFAAGGKCFGYQCPSSLLFASVFIDASYLERHERVAHWNERLTLMNS